MNATGDTVTIPLEMFEDLLNTKSCYDNLYAKLDLLVDEIRLNRQVSTDVLLRAINSPNSRGLEKEYKRLHELGDEDIEQD